MPVLSIDGAFGGLDPSKGRFLIYADRPEADVDENGSMVPVKVVRTILADIRMSPETFLSMARWMNAHADRFEAWCADASTEDENQEPA